MHPADPGCEAGQSAPVSPGAPALCPPVSIVIPARNEQSFIGRCLDSLLAQDYRGPITILVVDGDSQDGTPGIVSAYATHHPGVRLLSNPSRDCPHGLNVGIRAAEGTIIVRADAHCTFPPHYVRACVEPLLAGEAENVGVLQWGQGEGPWGKAVAAAMRSRFGAGDAVYRYGRGRRYVDTVFLGAWRKSYLEALGGFREECVVNQDYELSCRIRKAGGRILLLPDVRVTYTPRDSLRALARQYFRYGLWKVHTLCLHPWSLRWRQLAPPAFVVALLGSLAALPWTPWGWAIPGLYMAANLAASALSAAREGWRLLPRVAAAFAVIHLCWGAGFLAGLIVWPICRFRRRRHRRELAS